MRQLLVVAGIMGLAGVAVLETGCNKGGSTPAAKVGTLASQPAPSANLPTAAEVKDIGICCGKCEQNVKETLGKADGVGAVTCDVKTQVVTFKAADGKAANSGWEALKKAGYAGNFKVEGGFQSVGRPLLAGKSDEITIKNVHVCCGGCEKAIKGAIKEGDVTFEGSGLQKTVRITGKDLDVDKVAGALWQAGYSGQVEFKQ